MLDRSVRLQRQCDCPIVQIVIFLQETDDEIASTEAYINETTIHRYRTVRMWEEDPRFFLVH
jgi:predicted transposase YdaD